MDKDRLKKLAKEERFIPGIYNYCDRWCERCPQTSHCLNFACSEEESVDPETRDIENEAFWRKLSETFQDALELLKEAAEEHGIDLDSVDSEQTHEELEQKNATAKSHEVCRAAKVYSDLVQDWFATPSNLLVSSSALDEEKASLEEAIEVIRWYQHFIYVKLMRAVRGEMDERDEELDDLPKDSDGSAKIALIAIDRSIGAWGTIYGLDSLQNEKILRFIAYLDRLREEVEKAFPNARSFVRPGFD